MQPSLTYHELSTQNIAILSGFLLLLNLVDHALDRLLYCGLIGQILIGIIWGTPGTRWLSRQVEETVMQLGYVGLILIVYQGGLSTSWRPLRANLLLSTGVALTGIVAPISLSFLLAPIAGASPVQAFAAGAALCSTSLGTTFTVLSASGLSSTRLGVVLTSAAILDDVLGLIMVQVIANMGKDAFETVAVVRPVLVSLGFAVACVLVGGFVVRPLTFCISGWRARNLTTWGLAGALGWRETVLVVHTALLLGLVVGGTYAGTSSLLAAYAAGALVTWWDGEVRSHDAALRRVSNAQHPSAEAQSENVGHLRTNPGMEGEATRGINVYDHYYGSAVERILKPFFFASVGFSVPITKMFDGLVVWRGVVYALLMILGKIGCGIWLISFASPIHHLRRLVVACYCLLKELHLIGKDSDKPKQLTTTETSKERQDPAPSPSGDRDVLNAGPPPERSTTNHGSANNPPSAHGRTGTTSADPNPPVSLYPACILAFAMVARGEIGFLISALAESGGVFGKTDSDEPSELFLVATWAISLCTLVGPVAVGLLTRRVKRLEMERSADGHGRNVLGAWSVVT